MHSRLFSYTALAKICPPPRHIYPSNFSIRSLYHHIMRLLMTIVLLSTMFARWM